MTPEQIEAYRAELLADVKERGTHDRFTFVRKVQTGEAVKRGIQPDFRREAPEDLTLTGELVPEELRYALTYVSGRGWCLWATTREGTDVMPRDRDWHSLSDITSWERVGYAGIRVTLT